MPVLVSRLGLAHDPANAPELEQLLRALASFMCVPEGSEQACALGVPRVLVETVCRAKGEVRLAALGALAVYARAVPGTAWLDDAPPELATSVSALLSSPGPATLAVANVIAAVRSASVARALVQAGAAQRLCALLVQPGTAPARGALLRALSRLLHTLATGGEAAEPASGALDGWALVSAPARALLLLITRFEMESKLDRYLATSCLADWVSIVGDCETSTGIRARILPVVVELLGTPLPADLQHTPSCRLRELVASSNDLVSAALDLGAVPKLLDVLLANGGNPNPQAMASALASLARLAALSESQRRVIGASDVNAKLSGYLRMDPGVRAGTLSLLRSLSRSSLLVRGPLGEASMARQLVGLLAPGAVDTASRVAAAGALANLVVEDSPSRAAVLESGGLACFVDLALERRPQADAAMGEGADGEGVAAGLASGQDGSPASPTSLGRVTTPDAMRSELQLLGVWGLSSLAFRSQDWLKRDIAAALPWSGLHPALFLEEGAEPVSAAQRELSEKAWLLLRNLVHGAAESLPDLLAWAAQPPLLETFRKGVASTRLSAKARQHALYGVVNLASGPPAHKELLLNGGWASILVGLLGPGTGDEALQEAAIWALINLAWGGEADWGAAERATRIKAAGVERALRALGPDTSQAVLERAQQALEKLKLEPLLGRRAASGAPDWEGVSGLRDMEA